eukprot:m.96329 g.96329  ORF g.96329 m.96329 type:complete len:125 (-) comp13072_c0_seq1:2181-2555(-)
MHLHGQVTSQVTPSRTFESVLPQAMQTPYIISSRIPHPQPQDVPAFVWKTTTILKQLLLWCVVFHDANGLFVCGSENVPCKSMSKFFDSLAWEDNKTTRYTHTTQDAMELLSLSMRLSTHTYRY